MNKKIQAHVDGLFAGKPENRDILEAKEELLANLNDKYNDLVTSGKSEDDAFISVISGIGDISHLIGTITSSPAYNQSAAEKSRTMRGLLISTGVSLYVLSLAVLFLLSLMSMAVSGLIAMIIICAVATGMVVFGISTARGTPRSRSPEDKTFVADYIEKTEAGDRRKKMLGAATSSMWTLIAVLYISLSFLTGMWHITWIMFLIGACLQQVIVIAFKPRGQRKSMWHGVLWTLTVVVYFIISFGLNIWAYSWILFLGAAAAEQIIRLVSLWKAD